MRQCPGFSHYCRRLAGHCAGQSVFEELRVPPNQIFSEQYSGADMAFRLASLVLPPLSGKSFLHIGCGSGYFCGYAVFDAAKKVMGIDNDDKALANARMFFPNCVFEKRDWVEFARKDLACAPFDVILCSAGLHYAHDEPGLVELLMRGLAPRGLLVLELDIADHGSSDWIMAGNGDDARMIPTFKGIESMFGPYSWKIMDKTLPVKGLPASGYVVHMCNPQPTCVLLKGESGSGKTTVAKKFFSRFPCISGDMLWKEIAENPESFPQLGAICGEKPNMQRLDKLYRKMFAGDAWRQFMACMLERAQGRDFVFDGFIPPEGMDLAKRALQDSGYRVLCVETEKPEYGPGFLSSRARQDARKYSLYVRAYLGACGKKA